MTAAFLAAVEAERAGARPLHEQLADRARRLTESARHLPAPERADVEARAARIAQLADGSPQTGRPR